MNDRHPAGDTFPADTGADYSYAAYGSAHYEQSAYGSYGTAGHATVTQDDGWPAGAYDAQPGAAHSQDAASYGDGDPLYGHFPGGQDHLGTGTYPAASYETYGNGGYGTDGYGDGAYDAHGYGTGAYDATGWDGSGTDHSAAGLIPQQPGPEQAEHGWSAPADGSTQWDVNAFASGDFGTGDFGGTSWDGSAYGHQQTAEQGSDAGYGTGYDPGYDASGYDASGYEHAGYQHTGYENSGYDAAAYGTGGSEATAYGTGVYASGWTDGDAYGASGTPDSGESVEQSEQHGQGATTVGFHEQATATFDVYEEPEGHHDAEPGDPGDGSPVDAYGEPVVTIGSEAEPEPGAAVTGHPGRGRRRSPKPRRSALLTVAAPSVAVLGVAGIAAASVIPAGDEESPQAQAAPDTTEVKVSPANTKLDTQLAGLREAGDDFADRASRTQERIDLKKRQEAERKRAAAEAARREALRPKFALPVEGAGISAYFGQAGINWMSVHTGLDFPVSYGTPVKAATDGTVRTQWNPAYGNMMIVTSPDGTETWYCHLSSTRIRSGTVQAGDVIGYSGNSGNSTGPHLHFEVRPGGGSAIDPLAWFRSHGLEPS